MPEAILIGAAIHAHERARAERTLVVEGACDAIPLEHGASDDHDVGETVTFRADQTRKEEGSPFLPCVACRVRATGSSQAIQRFQEVRRATARMERVSVDRGATMAAERDAANVPSHELQPAPNDVPKVGEVNEPVPSATVWRSHVPPLGLVGPTWANAEAMASMVATTTKIATSTGFREDMEWRLP